MLHRLFIAGLVSCSLIASAEAPSTAPGRYSRRDLRTLIRTAHTAEQLTALSSYFRLQSESFRILAAKQNEEMQYALDHPIGGPKYPSAYDRAHRLKAYYEQQAEEASMKAAEYN